MKNNKLVNFYNTFFKSRETERDEVLIRNFINKTLEDTSTPYDSKVVDYYISDSQFVEKSIIKYISNMEHLEVNMEYLSLYAKQMNASAVKEGTDKIIIVDELLTYTTLSFFLTVYSYAYDNSQENEERCIQNMYSILENQGKKHTIKVHNMSDIIEMISLPKNIINLAMNTFWNAWTFIIGHELFHLSVSVEMPEIQEEYEADTYGYRILLHMIEKQKKEEVPESIRVYFENMYLAPIMLFQYFAIMDEYHELSGNPIEYIDHPSPENRQNHIFEMFETEVPDDFETDEGNEILNIFLEALESLRVKVYQKCFNKQIERKGYI